MSPRTSRRRRTCCYARAASQSGASPRRFSLKRALRAVALALAIATALSAAPAYGASSTAINWTADHGEIYCGIAARIKGSRVDPGTGAELVGLWLGLQCAAPGIPRAPGSAIGDPFVQLGQGRAGRARVVDESQDDLLSGAAPVALRSGTVWKRDGIKCEVHARSIRCTNSADRGFTLSPPRLQLL